MPSLLEGQLAQAIFQGFKGKLKTGTLRRVGSGGSGGKDELGDPLATSAQTWGFEGFTDNYTAYFKAQAGIPETDLKVCIFAKSLPAGVEPKRDDQAQIGGAWYQLRKADTDPATALWECQAYAIKAPAESA